MKIRFKTKRMFMLGLFSLGVSLSLCAQKVTLNYQNTKFETVLSSIKTQTGLALVFSDQLVNSDRKVSINVKDTPVQNALEKLLVGTGLVSEIKNGKLYIIEKKQMSSERKGATKAVSGVVVDELGEYVIGANVVIKGTTSGTVTDVDGKFIIEVGQGETLEISYIGYGKKEVVVDATDLNIKLGEVSKNLEEVVITAMGIERKAKSLTYATQNIEGKELTRSKETNMINGLQGKVSGVSITPNSGGAGGSSKILIRGNKSAQGNNEPLIVIDGMPMSNGTSAQGIDEFGTRDNGNALSNLNPDDIATINVLKGASAAALYGSMAANGVLLITTKKGKAGEVRVEASTNTTIENPIALPKLQSRYGALVHAGGSLADNSWGEKISGEAKGKNRVSDFYSTGVNTINSVSLSGGTEKAQTYLSYANTYSQGIIPNNTFLRHNFMLKESMKLFGDKLTVDGTVNYISQNVNNRPVGGQYRNPLTGLYTFPANGDFQMYKNEYARYNGAKGYEDQIWYRDVNQDFSANPYWVTNRNMTNDKRDRLMISGNIKYKITDYLNIQGRLNYDKTFDESERKIYAGTSTTIAHAFGEYGYSDTKTNQLYGDIMVNFNKEFGKFNLSASAGTSMLEYESGYHNSAVSNTIIPNYFSPANTSKNESTATHSRRRLNAVFATAQLGFKDMLYLDVTGRNDWASTLAYTNNISFFYPSFGLTGIVNEMVQLPDAFNMLKVRASYAIVGNDMPTHITHPLNSFNNGSVNINTAIPFKEMKPEKLKSFEVGFDLAMFNNRFDMDFTYYLTNNTNQYFSMSVPSGTGYRSYYFNAGNIQNSGFETTFNFTNSFSNDFSWRTSLNFSYNENSIKKLDDRLDYVTIGSIREIDFRLAEGGSYGDIYGKILKRDENGVIEVDNNGRPLLTSTKEYVGNVNPKWGVGFSNTFTYKDFQLFFLFDGKIGGMAIDCTQGTLDSYGVSEVSADARDNGGVDRGNGTMMKAYDYYTVVGAKGGATDMYAYSATNFRLRELSFGYTFRHLLGIGKNLSLNLVGRNLFFIYKDAPGDPELSMATSNAYNAVTYFSMPATRSLGINVKATF